MQCSGVRSVLPARELLEPAMLRDRCCARGTLRLVSKWFSMTAGVVLHWNWGTCARFAPPSCAAEHGNVAAAPCRAYPGGAPLPCHAEASHNGLKSMRLSTQGLPNTRGNALCKGAKSLNIWCMDNQHCSNLVPRIRCPGAGSLPWVWSLQQQHNG